MLPQNLREIYGGGGGDSNRMRTDKTNHGLPVDVHVRWVFSKTILRSEYGPNYARIQVHQNLPILSKHKELAIKWYTCGVLRHVPV